MSQNRILGSPYEIMTMSAPVPSVPWGFTTNHETDLYLVNPDGLNPVTVTLDPFAAPCDVVAIQDATGLSTLGVPIVIEASPGQTINLHPSGCRIVAAAGVIRAVLTMGEDNIWYVAFMGGP
jgi:hypothetical protein